MIRQCLMLRYRPTREDDGAGGFTEILGDSIEVFGRLTFPEGRTEIEVDAEEDIEVGDILEIAE